MGSKVDITVVIVNYNVRDFLLRCLNSVRQAQKDLDIEIIVVDNNSSDGSIEYLKPIFPEVEFIRQDKNVGFGEANNIGINKAQGKYVLILNPDTLLEEETLVKMYDFMEENHDIGVAGCKILNPDGTFQLSCRRGFPTPWAAFSRLFGLQKLFPKSKLFAKYNHTYRDINETYEIDAVSGSFMFCRKDALNEVHGFDTDFFMYGEDLDLCYRISQKGYRIVYYHETSIIHFLGESTRRSSINKLKHFYTAMDIFARKHFKRSALFLMVLKLGIFSHFLLASAKKYRRDLFVIFTDLMSINVAFIISTKIRYDGFFDLPDYAYPAVFIVISVILLAAMFGVGDYFESKPTLRKSFFALMISFFFLSSLTYFFKDYAFSRGIILMTIGFTIVMTGGIRLLIAIFDKTAGKEADRRIAFVGINKQTENIFSALQSADYMNAHVVGMISINESNDNSNLNLPVLGNIEYLPQLIEEYKIREVIITDDTLSKTDLIKIMAQTSNPSVRFHVAQEYDDLLASELTNEIAGIEPTMPETKITNLRIAFIKRTLDIVISIFLLTLGLPLIYLFVNYKAALIKKLWKVLTGKYSFIGLFPIEPGEPEIGKLGIIGLAHISNPGMLSKQAIKNLNDYYLQHYSLVLDTDIFLKFLFRKRKRGK